MKRIFTLALVLISAFALYAERRPMSEVWRIANSVLPTTKTQKRCIPAKQVLPEQNNDAFYIITNANQKGFVIVSADDRMPAILGYSDNDTYRSDMPEHVRAFLMTYNEALSRLDKGAAADEVFPMYAAKDALDSVGPLLGNIKYDQGEPFNRKCPTDNGARCVTGCIATAMSQVMRYYGYPAQGTGTYTISTKKQGKQATFDLSQLPFNWDLIKDDYTEGYTEAEANAVANLLIAAGSATGLSYGADATGGQTENAQKSLKNAFGFENPLYAGVTNYDKPYDDWLRTMVEEFRAGHPIIFGGTPGGDGHAFVLDGYKTAIIGISQEYPMDFLEEEDVLIHANWGWSGHLNGWFYLGHLQPEGENYSGYRWQMVYKIVSPNYVGVDNIEQKTRLTNADIFNILGQKVDKDDLQPGNIYIQNGHKFIYK